MSEKKIQQLVVHADIKAQPLSLIQIKDLKKQLKSTFRLYLNFIIGIFVMGAVVSYRTISLGYDTDLELLKISLYVGLSLGFFTGLMVSGDAMRRFKMIVISIIFSISVSLFSGMLTTLVIGGLVNWISSIVILGSALGCMWVLTHYDVVLKGLESLEFVDEKQFAFVKNAGLRFDVINSFNHKIAKEERIPTVGEYWVMDEWIRNQSEGVHE